MRHRSAYFLLIVASCPITTSVAVLPVLKDVVSIFSTWPAPHLWLSVYFIIPALMTALTSIALRNFLINIRHDLLLAAGIFGFALFGLSGLVINNGVLAILSRAAIGISSALTMNAFNALAFRKYDRQTSIWLLTFLNVATSSYGLLIALAVGELIKLNWTFAYIVFVVPAGLYIIFYVLQPKDELGVAGNSDIYRPKKDEKKLSKEAMFTIVAGHMAIHILVYLSMSKNSGQFLGYRYDTTIATIWYLFGHILGALSYRRVESYLSNPSLHVFSTLFFALISSLGLLCVGQSPLVLPFLTLVGMSLSHIMPAIFGMIRDSFPTQEHGKMIGSAVAAGFLGQFTAPFLLYLYWPIAGQAFSPMAMCALLSVFLLPIGFFLYMSKNKGSSENLERR